MLHMGPDRKMLGIEFSSVIMHMYITYESTVSPIDVSLYCLQDCDICVFLSMLRNVQWSQTSCTNQRAEKYVKGQKNSKCSNGLGQEIIVFIFNLAKKNQCICPIHIIYYKTGAEIL